MGLEVYADERLDPRVLSVSTSAAMVVGAIDGFVCFAGVHMQEPLVQLIGAVVIALAVQYVIIRAAVVSALQERAEKESR